MVRRAERMRVENEIVKRIREGRKGDGFHNRRREK